MDSLFKNKLEICCQNSTVFKDIKNNKSIEHKIYTSKVAKNIQNFKINLEHFFEIINSIQEELNGIISSKAIELDDARSLLDKINLLLKNKVKVKLEDDVKQFNSFLEQFKRKIEQEKFLSTENNNMDKIMLGIEKLNLEIEELKLRLDEASLTIKNKIVELENVKKQNLQIKEENSKMPSIVNYIHNPKLNSLLNEEVDLENKFNELAQELNKIPISETFVFYPEKNYLLLEMLKINENVNVKIYPYLKFYPCGIKEDSFFKIHFINITKSLNQLDYFKFNKNKIYNFIVIFPEDMYCFNCRVKTVRNYLKHLKIKNNLHLITYQKQNSKIDENTTNNSIINNLPFQTHLHYANNNSTIKQKIIEIVNNYFIDEKLSRLLLEKENIKLQLSSNEEKYNLIKKVNDKLIHEKQINRDEFLSKNINVKSININTNSDEDLTDLTSTNSSIILSNEQQPLQVKLEKEIGNLKEEVAKLEELIKLKNEEILLQTKLHENEIKEREVLIKEYQQDEEIVNIFEKFVLYIKTHIERKEAMYEFLKFLELKLNEFFDMENKEEILKNENVKNSLEEFLKLFNTEFENYKSISVRQKKTT